MNWQSGRFPEGQLCCRQAGFPLSEDHRDAPYNGTKQNKFCGILSLHGAAHKAKNRGAKPLLFLFYRIQFYHLPFVHLCTLSPNLTMPATTAPMIATAIIEPPTTFAKSSSSSSSCPFRRA